MHRKLKYKGTFNVLQTYCIQRKLMLRPLPPLRPHAFNKKGRTSSKNCWMIQLSDISAWASCNAPVRGTEQNIITRDLTMCAACKALSYMTLSASQKNSTQFLSTVVQLLLLYLGSVLSQFVSKFNHHWWRTWLVQEIKQGLSKPTIW